jgi:predicted Zn-dependent protease
MKKWILFLVVLVLTASCVRNLVTGRKQLSLVSESQLQAMALNQYSEFLSEHKVLDPATNDNAAMVTRVGNRISKAVTQYYTNQGKPQILEGYNWEFSTIDDKDVVNAWCMPGGKVAVYTGLLKVTQNETALAIVMGHEIAHAVAKHGSERMSQALMQQLGGMALDVALTKEPEQTRNLFLLSYGIGSQLGAMLPWSRQQETEADKFGLIFSAMAGYDPREAIPFWERMSAAGGDKPPEFLSTHPSDETRIKKLKELMPEALKYYSP